MKGRVITGWNCEDIVGGSENSKSFKQSRLVTSESSWKWQRACSVALGGCAACVWRKSPGGDLFFFFISNRRRAGIEGLSVVLFILSTIAPPLGRARCHPSCHTLIGWVLGVGWSSEWVGMVMFGKGHVYFYHGPREPPGQNTSQDHQ